MYLLLEGAAPEALLALRTADNLYRVLLRFRAGPHRADLPAVRAAVASVDLRGVDLQPLGGEGPQRASRSPSFSVNASRAGRHTYSRFELSAAASAGILDRYPRWRQGDPQRHDLELRLDLSGPDAVLSLRLTPPQFRFRGARTFSPAALRPTVAHALVWLTRPDSGRHLPRSLLRQRDHPLRAARLPRPAPPGGRPRP